MDRHFEPGSRVGVRVADARGLNEKPATIAFRSLRIRRRDRPNRHPGWDRIEVPGVDAGGSRD